jgi:hypothetical protein
MRLRSEIEYIYTKEELSDSPFNVPFIAEVQLRVVIVESNKVA